jgi:hypothetical protein
MREFIRTMISIGGIQMDFKKDFLFWRIYTPVKTFLRSLVTTKFLITFVIEEMEKKLNLSDENLVVIPTSEETYFFVGMLKIRTKAGFGVSYTTCPNLNGKKVILIQSEVTDWYVTNNFVQDIERNGGSVQKVYSLFDYQIENPRNESYEVESLFSMSDIIEHGNLSNDEKNILLERQKNPTTIGDYTEV